MIILVIIGLWLAYNIGWFLLRMLLDGLWLSTLVLVSFIGAIAWHYIA